MLKKRLTAQQVKALREQLGLTQAEFAREVGTTSLSVSRWERGIYKPSRVADRLLRELSARSLAKVS